MFISGNIGMKAGPAISFAILTFCILFLVHYLSKSPSIEEKNIFENEFRAQPAAPSRGGGMKTDMRILHHCRHVFLDVGSNVGITVRKLFEPNLYPDASVLPYFDQFFGTFNRRDLKEVCAIGFEPNPKHIKRLRSLEKAYRKCGWRIKFWTNTGVSDFNGRALVNQVEDDSLDRKTFIHRITGDKYTQGKETRVLRLAQYIENYVAARELPSRSKPSPSVVIKMDIEGSEFEVLADMVTSGALNHVNMTLVEWHHDGMKSEEKKTLSRNLETALQTLSNITKKFQIVNLNDESYSFDDFPLPNC